MTPERSTTPSPATMEDALEALQLLRSHSRSDKMRRALARIESTLRDMHKQIEDFHEWERDLRRGDFTPLRYPR